MRSDNVAVGLYALGLVTVMAATPALGLWPALTFAGSVYAAGVGIRFGQKLTGQEPRRGITVSTRPNRRGRSRKRPESV